MQVHWIQHLGLVTPEGSNSSRTLKISKITRLIQAKYVKYFLPCKLIAIDETKIAFNGRVSFKMYNPTKPTWWGLRVYVLADCNTG